MSNDNSQGQLNSARPWAVYFKQAKSNLEEINASLIKHLENVEKENGKLKEALSELHFDNKEKEQSLDDSHKIVTKLNEEYSKLMKEFKSLEQYSSELETESFQNKKIFEDVTKSHNLFEKVQKQNSSLKNENENLKKEISSYKKESLMKSTDTSKFEKDIKDKSNIILEYKSKLENYETMIAEREKVITEYDNKFYEITSNINKKDQELKILLKITQEFGSENKSNVEELTKQAISTIKVFYNSLNNNQGYCQGNSCREKNNNFQNEYNFISKKEIESLIKDNKTSFLLEEAITCKDLVHEKGCIPKEFMKNINLKSELLKCELFSSLLRELNFVKFVDGLIPNNNDVSGNENNEVSPNNLIENAIIHMENLRIQNEDLEKEINKLKKDYNRILDYKIEVQLYIQKLKEDAKAYSKRMREGIEQSEKSFSCLVNLTKENAKNLNAINILNKNIQILNKDLKTAHAEILSLKKDRDNKDHLQNLLNKDNKIERLDSLSFKSKNSNKDNLNGSIQSNDSFNERSYNNKKEENSKLKDQIERLKDEISNLIRMNTICENKLRELTHNQKPNYYNLKIVYNSDLYIPNENERLKLINKYLDNDSLQRIDENNKSELNCGQCFSFLQKINDFKSHLKSSTFKDLKTFYISYQMDMEKINSKINEVATKFTSTENQFANEEGDKKIKVSQVREIISQVHRLISLFSLFINKYNKDVYHYTSNLKKMFDFINKLVYSKDQNSFSSLMSSKKFNKSVSIENILRIIYESNGKVFASSELKKISLMYENKSVLEIIEVFKINCQVIRDNMVEKLDYDTELSEIEDSFMKYSGNNKRNSDINMNNSYKIVNERIIKLKKFEFDFSNLIQIVKNYLVAQELVFKLLFGDVYKEKDNYNSINNEIMTSDAFKNHDYLKSKFEIINKLLHIAEETLLYKSNETEGDIIFMRRMTIRLLKNQKYYLGLALDS